MIDYEPWYPAIPLFESKSFSKTFVLKSQDFRALGQLVKGSVVWDIFSSLLPIVCNDVGRNRWVQSVNTWLHGLCYHHSFGFFDDGMFYTIPGLLVSDGIFHSQRGKRVFAQELVGLIDGALN